MYGVYDRSCNSDDVAFGVGESASSVEFSIVVVVVVEEEEKEGSVLLLLLLLLLSRLLLLKLHMLLILLLLLLSTRSPLLMLHPIHIPRYKETIDDRNKIKIKVIDKVEFFIPLLLLFSRRGYR